MTQAVQLMQKNIETCLKKLCSYDLPKYSEDDESSFIKSMMLDKLSNKLSSRAGELEELLEVAETVSTDLQLDMSEFFSEETTQEKVKMTISSIQCAVCSATSLKILNSKAAAKGSSALLDSVVTTLGFIEEKKIELPGNLDGRLRDLKKLIEDQSTRNQEVKGRSEIKE